MAEREIFDVVGIGFGPANLALAITLQEMEWDGSRIFFERAGETAWQPEMLLSGSDIQHHPLRDLVTPRNPRSYYSFVNYLHQDGRLFDFLNVPIHFALRKDYAKYVAWAAKHFDHEVRYGTSVAELAIEESPGAAPLWRIGVEAGGGQETTYARSIVVGTGRSPRIPPVFAPHLGERVFHLTDYLRRIGHLAEEGRLRRVVVVGASQSAVELMLDLSSRFPATEAVCVMRSWSFRLKDTSPFSDEIYFPHYVDYYYSLDDQWKASLDQQLSPTNYSSADLDVLQALYIRRYEQKLDGELRLKIVNHAEVQRVQVDDEGVTLTLAHLDAGTVSALEADAVVLATGFRNFGVGEGEEPILPLLAPCADRFAMTPRRGVSVTRAYALQPADPARPIPPTYLNGLCESTHGLGDAGSFSLLSLRTRDIVEDLVPRLAEERRRRTAQMELIDAEASPWRLHLGRHYRQVLPTEHITAPFGLALSRIDPLGSTTRHSHPDREGFFIFEGHPEIEVGGERERLAPGDVVSVDPGEIHCMHNVSPDETVVYACLWWDAERESDLDVPWPLTLPSDNGTPRVAAADRRS